MSERQRVLFLIMIMTAVAVVVGGVSIILLYQTALQEERARLVETAQSQARLLEAVARFDALYSRDYPGGPDAATLSQIRDAHANYAGFGETGEFTLARREGNLIVFLLSHRHYDLDLPQPVPFDSALAEPMRLSLSGQSGTVIGLDYRGETVLAAYEPVAELDLGIVVKIDLAEVQAPFQRASLIAGLSAVGIVGLGALLFLWVTNPLLENLQESENKFRSIAENAVDYIFIKDKARRYTYVNQAMQDLLGLPEQEILGKTPEEVFGREQGRIVKEVDDRAFSGTAVNETRSLVVSDNQLFFNTFQTPLSWEDGEVTLIMGIVRDVTERVRVEEALREERDRAQKYLDIAGVMFVALDARGEVTLINQRGSEVLGYAQEEIIGKNWFDSFLPASIKDQTKIVFDSLMAGQIEPVEYYENSVLTRDGEERIVAWHNTTLKNDEGQVVGTLSSGEDITDRKRGEEERARLTSQVREQARRVEQILATVPEGVMLLDAEGRVLQANPVAKKDLATLAETKVGDVLTRLGDRPLAELLTSPPTEGLWHQVEADRRTFEVIARPVENGPEPEHWVLVINDVTRERDIQAQLQRQERLAAVGQLAAGIAHDFNNIMASIVLYAQITARSEELSERNQERMAVINQQARHATQLIEQILDFSRRAVLERRPLDLLPLLKEQVNLLERTVPEHIRIELDYGRDEYTVHADSTRMQQMLTNLAVNARDAMPDGGTLRIGLERITVERKSSPLPEMEAGEWLQLTVSDTGTGIPLDVLPHIFEPFFTTKAPGAGSGLGLAQVYGIVGQHEGHIDVTSWVGAGTAFTIYLPALSVTLSKELPKETQALPQGEGETILVVEDDATMREALADTLELINYRVLTAANGREALELLERHTNEIVLILSDLVMPEMGGQALFQALKQRDLILPVVMLSGHPMENELEGLKAQGLAGWLLKPPSVEQLAELLRQVLEETSE